MGTNGTMMGFLTENPPKLSSGARDFIRAYPNRARMAIAVALEAAAAQIVGAGRVVPGLADVVEAIGDPELAWAFLSQDWPFEDGVGQPLDRLNDGRIEEVVAAAAGFGATFA